jgi:uncharacterized metal-binding protein YceD (DUF177 family)
MDQPVSLKFSSLEIQEHGGLHAVRTLESEALVSLGVESPCAGPVALEMDFSVGGKEILLQGAARGRWRLECSRCLVAVTPDFESLLERTYPLSAELIDVAEELRESLLLSVPLKPLCKPGCLGLCPHCGKNLNDGPCGCEPDVPSAFAKLKETRAARKQRKK